MLWRGRLFPNAYSALRPDLNRSGLQKEMEYVEERQKRSGFRRLLEAQQHLDNVEGCRRRVETLSSELQVSLLRPARTCQLKIRFCLRTKRCFRSGASWRIKMAFRRNSKWYAGCAGKLKTIMSDTRFCRPHASRDWTQH